MKLRTKAVILISLSSLVVFLILHLVAVFVLLPTFSNLEKQENQEAVSTATKALDFSISDLGRRVMDWAVWDDTYYFAQNGNSEYIQNYLADSAFHTLEINFFMVINHNGSIIYCKSVDLSAGLEIPTSQETQDRFQSDSLIWNFSSPNDIVSGVFLLPNQTFLIASAPILTSLGEGPIMGALIYGEDISSIENSHISEIANLAITMNRVDKFPIQGDSQFQSLISNENTIITKTNGSSSISGYTVVKDINSNPAIIMQVSQDRDVYRQGQNVEYIFLITSLFISISTGLGTLLLLERSVVRPLNKLTGYIKGMPTNPNNPKNPPKFGTEETSILADTIKDAMAQKLETIREMGGMIGHDLHNPLTGIKGAAYYLKTSKTKLTETDKAMLKTIDDCVEYSNKIVNDLLDYSGEIRLELLKTTPKKLLEISLSTISIPGYIQLVDETKTDPQFMVDIGKISRVFNNLIKNAFDALEKGGQLIISSREVSGNVEIEFSDTGTGITEEAMKKLWVPFFTTKAKGMGFGLSICKRIIEAHGGKISVVSNLGKGSVFTVSFPLKRETAG
jgi:signal transduction histidine kinase